MKREDVNFTRVTFTKEEVARILSKEGGLKEASIRFEDRSGLPCYPTRVIIST